VGGTVNKRLNRVSGTVNKRLNRASATVNKRLNRDGGTVSKRLNRAGGSRCQTALTENPPVSSYESARKERADCHISLDTSPSASTLEIANPPSVILPALSLQEFLDVSCHSFRVDRVLIFARRDQRRAGPNLVAADRSTHPKGIQRSAGGSFER
jgi:hypothetical protein